MTEMLSLADGYEKIRSSTNILITYAGLAFGPKDALQQSHSRAPELSMEM